MQFGAQGFGGLDLGAWVGVDGGDGRLGSDIFGEPSGEGASGLLPVVGQVGLSKVFVVSARVGNGDKLQGGFVRWGGGPFAPGPGVDVGIGVKVGREAGNVVHEGVVEERCVGTVLFGRDHHVGTGGSLLQLGVASLRTGNGPPEGFVESSGGVGGVGDRGASPGVAVSIG